MILWLSLFSCWLQPPKSPTATINKPEVQTERKPVDKKTGTEKDGIFYDYTFPFSAVIPSDWQVDPQPQGSSMRLRLKHSTKDTIIEVWYFQEIILSPTRHDFCTWSFIDRAQYDLSTEDIIVATCVPDDTEAPFVFAYIKHWSGSWQFEIHVPQAQYIEEKKEAEKVLSQFYWRDDVDIPALRP